MEIAVYTVIIDNWFPELCEITVPLIAAWSEKIGADFQIISGKKFASWPPNYEKFQIWERGGNYHWNIYLDADMIVDPARLPDFTLNSDPTFVYYESRLWPSRQYKPHPYFIRYGLDFGISDCFFMSSMFTHDIWQPSEFSFEEARSYCSIDRETSEFALNLNIARYGLKVATKIGYDKNHFHLQTTDDYNRQFNGGPKFLSKKEHVERALRKIREMGIDLEFYKKEFSLKKSKLMN